MYLWGDHRPKISIDILQLDKSAGGIQLADLFKRQIALKTQWVIIIKNSQFWLTVAYQNINPRIDDRICSCNLVPNDVTQICKGDNFWTKVLYSWCLYNYEDGVDSKLVNCKIIWYNSHIKIGNKIIG